MAELTEQIIARSLWMDYGTGQIACANIFYYAFESDLLILRNSGTVVEYEIKLSVSDFRAGQKKKQALHGSDKRRRVNRLHPAQKEYTRYEYLTSGYGANMFYYVMPQEVIDKVELPKWAGIIRVAPNHMRGLCSRLLIKKAKMLHRRKEGDELKKKILTSCYYKYWRNYAHKELLEAN